MKKLTAKEIKMLREHLMLTLTEFAAKIGVDKMSVWNWEHGRREPRRKSMRILSEIWDETFSPCHT